MIDLISLGFLGVHLLQEVIQSIFKRVHGGRLHDAGRKSIPYIDYPLGKKILRALRRLLIDVILRLNSIALSS